MAAIEFLPVIVLAAVGARSARSLLALAFAGGGAAGGRRVRGARHDLVHGPARDVPAGGRRPRGNATTVWHGGIDDSSSLVQAAGYDRAGPQLRALTVRSVARLSYALTDPARVRFTVQRMRGGRTVAGRCVKPTRANRTGRACVRLIRLTGAFTRDRPAGADAFTFSGRLGGRALRPGAYRLRASPQNQGRRGTTRVVRLTIVR